MLVLHLSDIHFRHPTCNTDRDSDRPFRTRLLQDARERTKTLGPIDAILVDVDHCGRRPADFSNESHGDEQRP
jgi:hypothetical protein